jgi:GR25 family glycosyltransferase involved in LPS biosynthesis
MDSTPNIIRIETKMALKDFMRLVFFLTYRRPMVLLVTFLGIVFSTWGALALVGIIDFAAFSPGFTLLYGLFFLGWIPAAAYLRGRKQYASSKRSQELRKFEFTPQGIQMETETSNVDYKWSTVYEVKRSGKWVLIYLSRAEAIFIPRDAFSEEKFVAFTKLMQAVPSLRKPWK